MNLEEAMLEIGNLRKALIWSIETIEIIQKELIIDVKKFGYSTKDSDELIWVKSLVEKNNGNDHSS